MVRYPQLCPVALPLSAGAPISAAVHGAGTPDGALTVTVTVTAAEVARAAATSMAAAVSEYVPAGHARPRARGRRSRVAAQQRRAVVELHPRQLVLRGPTRSPPG